MSESCNVIVVNNSGRSLDAVAMWHFPIEPPGGSLPPNMAFLKATNVAPGQKANATTSLTWGSPTDYWLAGVRFHGDGETYLLSGMTYEPWKEYEVSSGSTITFVINQYSVGTANQSDITIQYTGDGGGSAHLINHTTAILAEIGNAIVDEIAEMIVEMVAG
jgi:hypothetical protein